MFRAAGHEDPAVANHAGDQAPDRAADVALRVDIGVIEHGVPVAADTPAAIRLALDQDSRNPPSIGSCDLRIGRDTDIGKHVHDGADIERISRILDFKGRIEREHWIEQARILATGGQTEFSRRGER